IIKEEGYMTSTIPQDIEGRVKVDIHQQEHKDWEAIKTSIHIGALVDGVQVSFPIPSSYICEADDFAIRTYDAYYTLNEITFNLTAEVAHEADQVIITIKDFPSSVTSNQLLESEDGLTVEVWTYPRQPLASEDPTAYRQLIFNMLKQAKVKVGVDQPNYSPNMNTPARNGEMYTQVSSAYF
ncbi:MAG: hypothetical protein PHP31_09590, partial [Lentimicrobiaceae bacterium]|nr:hypothetical protein [Lentimicrobiaceae bacterium]